jgi:hypothetical protein
VNAELALMWKWLWPVFRFEHFKYEVWSVRHTSTVLVGPGGVASCAHLGFLQIEFWFVADVSGHPVGPKMLVTGYHSLLHKVSEVRISDLH